MKRWTMALAALVTGALSLAHADYVKIMINVGGSPDRKATGQPGAGVPGGGEIVAPGGGEASAPGGGIRGGLGQPGGRLVGIGGPGGAGRGGSPDDLGGPTPGGGGGDMLGGRQPGAETGGGGGRGATLGSLGGMGNLGGLVGGESTTGGEGMDSRAIWVEAVIEYDAKDARTVGGGSLYVIKHQFGGQAYLPVPMPNNPSVRVIREGPITAFVTDQYRLIHIKGPTLAQRYEQKRKEMAKLKQDNDVTAQLNLAQWALQHGLVDEVPKIMTQAAKAEPKHPVVLAFQKTEADIRRDAKPGDDGEVWRERLGNFRMLDGRHYRVVYEETEALARRLAGRLEKNFRSFYYWWALRGTPLPVPEHKLVVILVEEERAFDYQHKNIFDETPMAADGFLARRDNVAIFSGKRLDSAFDALGKFARPYMLGLSPADLLAGKGWSKTKSPYDVATAQTLRLMQEALQDEAEFMTTSHEGTRQLIAAVGLLPRAIAAPQWIDYGMGSFFETHKGAFWASTAGPSWVHLNAFKNLEKDKRFEKTDANLKNVVTDHLFHEAKELDRKEKEDRQKERERAKTPTPGGVLQPEPPAPRESEKDKDTAEKALGRARAMSWGLTYFLAQQRMPQLLRYYQELNQLPRDLRFDADVLWITFARAFDLEDSGKPGQVDGAKVFKLASEWQRFLKNTPLPAAELRREVVKEDSKSP